MSEDVDLDELGDMLDEMGEQLEEIKEWLDDFEDDEPENTETW